MSDFSKALLAVQEELAGLKNGTVAFVLPGVQIMVFPIGLVITSVWLAIGVAAYAVGIDGAAFGCIGFQIELVG